MRRKLTRSSVVIGRAESALGAWATARAARLVRMSFFMGATPIIGKRRRKRMIMGTGLTGSAVLT
jgi:hypothetical protein